MSAARLRRLLLTLLAVSALGTGAELLLLGHTEDRWQLVPVVLLGSGFFVAVWLMCRPGAASLATSAFSPP